MRGNSGGNYRGKCKGTGRRYGGEKSERKIGRIWNWSGAQGEGWERNERGRKLKMY